MTQPEMPTLVIVGPYRLAICTDENEINRVSAENGSALAGCYESDRGHVIVKPTLAPDSKAEVLLHEILHAIFDTVGKPVDDETEERIVGALAPTLLDTLRRNPPVTAWLMGGE